MHLSTNLPDNCRGILKNINLLAFRYIFKQLFSCFIITVNKAYRTKCLSVFCFEKYISEDAPPSCNDLMDDCFCVCQGEEGPPSLEYIKAKDLFPQKELVKEDDSLQVSRTDFIRPGRLPLWSSARQYLL